MMATSFPLPDPCAKARNMARFWSTSSSGIWLSCYLTEKRQQLRLGGSAHPGVKVISRDRGGSYAEAAREGAPLATQIADRFHLSQNLGETLERVLRREYPASEQLFAGVPQAKPSADPSLPLLRHEAEKQVSQQRRMTVYERVNSLAEQGYNQADIATQLRMSRKKVRQLLQGPPRPPVYKSRPIRLTSSSVWERRHVTILYSCIEKFASVAMMAVVLSSPITSPNCVNKQQSQR
jgi:Transposase